MSTALVAKVFPLKIRFSFSVKQEECTRDHMFFQTATKSDLLTCVSDLCHDNVTQEIFGLPTDLQNVHESLCYLILTQERETITHKTEMPIQEIIPEDGAT